MTRWDFAIGVTYILAIACVVLMLGERRRIRGMSPERPAAPPPGPVRWICKRCGGSGEEPVT